MSITNDEMTAKFNEIIDNTKNLAELLIAAYNTMRKEMLDHGAPRELAEDAAETHVRTILKEMLKDNQR